MQIALGLDLETSGLLDEPFSHRIIEICLLPYDLDTGKRLGCYTARFNPGRPIDAKAQEVHGISFSDVAHEPLLEAAPDRIAIIQKLLSKSQFVVAHNGVGFDWPFMQAEFSRIGQHLPQVHMLDTMLDARWATHNGKYPNLGELCFAMRVDYDPSKAHSAEYDTGVMMECALKGIKQGFFKVPG